MRELSMAMVREGCPMLGHGLCEREVWVWVITTLWRGFAVYVHRVIKAIVHGFLNTRK